MFSFLPSLTADPLSCTLLATMAEKVVEDKKLAVHLIFVAFVITSH
jgi:hypothetical protein